MAGASEYCYTCMYRSCGCLLTAPAPGLLRSLAGSSRLTSPPCLHGRLAHLCRSTGTQGRLVSIEDSQADVVWQRLMRWPQQQAQQGPEAPAAKARASMTAGDIAWQPGGERKCSRSIWECKRKGLLALSQAAISSFAQWSLPCWASSAAVLQLCTDAEVGLRLLCVWGLAGLARWGEVKERFSHL